MRAGAADGASLMVVVVRKRALAALILLIAVVFLITSNTFWRWMYPIGYQPEIRRAASEAHIDPLLVASVIRVESQFHSEDVSHAGAIGLMQLMPDTAQWLANQMNGASGSRAHAGAEGSAGNVGGAGNAGGAAASGSNAAGSPVDTARLADPDVNIRLGTWYIRYLVDLFHGNQVAAIAAYNSGPKRVSEWLADGTWNGQLKTLNDIPVGETRHFVGRVFYNYDLYQRIYGNDPLWRKPPAAGEAVK
ncbi:soluble lytic murein transglycosylase [Alicyclobacillus macrosporangiidus]|uniref:Soluble lytic murein transglycosylase n=2 Tax=Alicyclobacillus macrosporangiidus TaxID=392015 RepID=A0A1I7GAP5_9BACL|nr:soluble lytic murein transglycosylase [Alicyclobacillus macrosporangiidus]